MPRTALCWALGAATVAAAAGGPTPAAQPLCPEEGLWGVAWCLTAETAGLARDAVAFALSAAAEALPAEVSGPLAGLRPPPELASALAAALGPEPGAALGAALADAARGAAAALPADAAAALLEAAAARGAAFAEAFPGRARLLPEAADERSAGLAAFGVAAWLALAALLAGRAAGALCRGRRPRSEVLFFPDRSGRHLARLCAEIGRARRRIWLAMFTLTDDALSEAILRAHRRGVDVRIVVDDDQCKALGADAQGLAAAGVPVVADTSSARMHHKFVILDQTVFTGSFNWTRQASTLNCENLCVLREPGLVKAFAAEFGRLWRDFGGRGRGAAAAAAAAPRGRGAEVAKRRRGRDRTPPPNRGGC